MTDGDLLEAGARRTVPAPLQLAALVAVVVLVTGLLLAHRPPPLAGSGTQVVPTHQQYQPLSGRILT